jgi:hypothetical protein
MPHGMTGVSDRATGRYTACAAIATDAADGFARAMSRSAKGHPACGVLPPESVAWHRSTSAPSEASGRRSDCDFFYFFIFVGF